jgi:hypothetical protein
MPNFQGVWNLSEQYQAIGSQNWPMAPGAPTGVSASAGDTQATVSFTAPIFEGVPPGITQYLVTSNPDAITETGSASPITVTGLTNGTSYTFSVQATNGVQFGPAGVSGSVSPTAPIGLFGGIDQGGLGNYNSIEKITISTTGNSTDFGDLSVGRNGLGSCSSSTRAVFVGGASSNVMDYVTISSAGNAIDFGDLNSEANGASAASNATRGIVTRFDDIFFFTIATTGNSATFGNWGEIREQAGMCANDTRAVVAGGNSAGANQSMDFVVIATTGSQASFGTISGLYNNLANGVVSSGTRGVFAGGFSSSVSGQTNAIAYITIASEGNSTDFGDLTQARYSLASCSSTVRGTFAGGISSVKFNVIDYITIASTGNATDFGDLTTDETNRITGCSNAHGGLA